MSFLNSVLLGLFIELIELDGFLSYTRRLVVVFYGFTVKLLFYKGKALFYRVKVLFYMDLSVYLFDELFLVYWTIVFVGFYAGPIMTDEAVFEVPLFVVVVREKSVP